MPLRKAVMAGSALIDNVASFVNVTNKRLHIRKLVQTLHIRGTVVAGDEVRASIDEVPVNQMFTNDSRSHLMGLQVKVDTALNNSQQQILSFNRGDLVLDPDEAIFLNNNDLNGAPTISSGCNIYYED